MAEFFPIFRRAKDTTVLIIGDNCAAEEKYKKLSAYPFNIIVQKLNVDDPEALLSDTSADFVILADKKLCDAKKLFKLCTDRRIGINSVDDMENSNFIFPSLITGDSFSIAISTDGKCPSAAVKTRQIIENNLPVKTDNIIGQLSELRLKINSPNKKQLIKKLCDAAFEKGSPLEEHEISDIIGDK